MSTVVERMAPDSWQRVRALRLRGLAESPDAFGSTHAEDSARPEADWRAWIGDSDSACFLAVEGGRDVGIAFGAPWDGRADAAGLFGMWVEPGSRRAGVGGALVDAVVAWARGRGHERVLLDVADANASAIALYASRGFVPNGVTGTLPLPREHVTEHRRELVLRR